jgi:hypothetical protein
MNNKNYIAYTLVAVLCSFFSCSDMDDTYEEFVQDGEIIYSPKVNAVTTAPGHNRLQVGLLGLSSRVSKVRVSWNNNANYLDFQVPADARRDTFNVILPDMPEGSYSLSVVTFDQAGRNSVKADTTGNVYGDNYGATLKPRLLKQIQYSGNDLELTWGGVSSGTLGSILYFEDKAGVARQKFIAPSDNQVLENFGGTQYLKFKTLFLPEAASIDTFYSTLDSVLVEGPRVQLSKTGWTATASSFDTRGGSSYRPPSNAIDDNISTIWVNWIGSPAITYPHTITVDMQQPRALRGLSFVQRQDLSGVLKLLEIQVSTDNENWQSMGDFTLEKIKEIQYLDFPSVGKVRYFRVIGKSDYNNSKNISLAEVGAFIR